MRCGCGKPTSPRSIRSIKPDLEEEARLSARYTELLASAKLEIAGQTVNLAGLGPYAEDPDRSVRHEAERVRWGFFAANADALDEMYDQLVKLRHGMARKLGFATYTPLGYRRLRRVDYGPDDVARYREQVVRHVVPLVARLLEARRAENGWDRLRFWDEALIDPAGNPKPAGDHDTLVAAAAVDVRRHGRPAGVVLPADEPGRVHGSEEPAGQGRRRVLHVVSDRRACRSFSPTSTARTTTSACSRTRWGMRSRTGKAATSRAWITCGRRWRRRRSTRWGWSSCPIPASGCWSGEAAADRFRRMHLIGALAFLPYGVCVDHFQHEVYAHPDASPAERHAMWARLEKIYMPWADYGDLDFLLKGGRWQAKPHIYGSPFYYIDYTLAQCCAMQFWVKSRRDYAAAMEAYVALCARGGSAPFQTLVRSAGLVSPFADGALADVVQEAAAVLGV